jgi:hypothetical protein
MKVRSGKFLVLGAVLAASVSLAGIAYADSVSGTAWELPTFNTIPAVYPSPSSASATFTLTSASGVFNLNSANISNGYTLGGFLVSGGDTAAVNYINGALATDDLDNTLFNFTGTTELVNGTMYSFAHDDGMTFTADGTEWINAPGPTSAVTTSFTFTGVTGTYAFDLQYAEVDGPPAVLDFAISSVASTPEPGSIFLLGTGLLALAFLVRRTLTA